MHYYDDELTLYGLVRDVFVACAVTCFLWAMHRVARGVILVGQVNAYDELEDAFTPEEREQLIHRIKTESARF